MRLRAGRLALTAATLTCVAALAGCGSSGSSQPGAPGSTAPGSTGPGSTGAGSTGAGSNGAASPTAAGTASSSGNTPAGASPSSPSSPAAACPASALRVTQGVAQGYAGGVYQVIDFTNTSGSTCTLYGYPGVSLVSGPPYTQIGLAAKRSTSTPRKLVTLAPGATANALLQIVDALNYPAPSCGPAKATALKVYPPSQTVPVYLPNTSNGCTKPVQIMYIGAVQRGSGSSS
jgi:Protein of unknown function (DUF4232)